MNEVADAIYDELAASTSLTALVGTRIYRGVAPHGAIYPLVTIEMVGGGTVTETPQDSADPLYLVSAISEISPAEAGTLAGYIHTALHKVTLTVSGWTNIWTAVTTHYEAVGLPSAAGKPLYQTGRFVRILLSK